MSFFLAGFARLNRTNHGTAGFNSPQRCKRSSVPSCGLGIVELGRGGLDYEKKVVAQTLESKEFVGFDVRGLVYFADLGGISSFRPLPKSARLPKKKI